MTHTIVVNGSELEAFNWREAEAIPVPEGRQTRHVRDRMLLENGVLELAPGEVYFHCDLTLAFDTLLELKGDGRKFVIIASGRGDHVAKPY